MGKHRMSRRGLRGAVAAVMLGGLAAACSGTPGEPAPVFMKGGAPGVAATGMAPAVVGRPPIVTGPLPRAAMPRETRQITVQRGQSVGSLAGEYHVSKQAIIAANHLEAPYKIKIGTRLVIPAAAAPPVQQAMVPAPMASGPGGSAGAATGTRVSRTVEGDRVPAARVERCRGGARRSGGARCTDAKPWRAFPVAAARPHAGQLRGCGRWHAQ
jgi:LysM repeat protein